MRSPLTGVIFPLEMLTVEQLERWALFGAGWRVVSIDDAQVVVDLCTCTGETVERQRSADPGVIGYLRSRPSADVSGEPSSG